MISLRCVCVLEGGEGQSFQFSLLSREGWTTTHAFNKAAKDGSVSRNEFLAMAKDKVGGSSSNAAAVPRASAPEAGAPAGKKANSKKAGKAKVSVVEECRDASPFSKASMARVHAFLLGTHPRAGEESLIRKLAPEPAPQVVGENGAQIGNIDEAAREFFSHDGDLDTRRSVGAQRTKTCGIQRLFQSRDSTVIREIG